MNYQPLEIKDCAVIPIATAIRAQSLSELRDKIAIIHEDSIYHHFWGRFFDTQFKNTEFHNDFAWWSHHAIRDDFLAERLSMVDPSEYDNLDQLRAEIVRLINDRLEELEFSPSASRDNQFHFIRSKMIVFDTPQAISNPMELVQVVQQMSATSLFYHVIDAKNRNANQQDDFCSWLSQYGEEYAPLITKLKSADPYFLDPQNIKEFYTNLFTTYFVEERVI
ncbi:hypothetical protein BN1013_01365 [Candidatus Rubidus massiliensis]|nr:MAG: hypothetical protein BGO10_04215 [Chlamydia sp. 32-24]CDZ80842.1 hypothetical protein BN1013_01365 [Candidatus Rubidus massiliensis]